MILDNSWPEKPSTECGHYYKYTAGGVINFHGPMRGLPGYFDCVWVISKHSAFDFLHLRITNSSAPGKVVFLLTFLVSFVKINWLI